MATNELSRRTVIVLVSLAVILSVLSTTLTVTTVYNYSPDRIGGGMASGQVTLYVPPQPTASGTVILEVP